VNEIKKTRNLYVYDLETYPNFFLATFKNVDNKNFYRFEISDRKSDITSLYDFLNQKDLLLIGFNNVNFDYPVLHNTILKYKRKWTAKAIYNAVEEIIQAEYSSIPDKWTKIPQLDLYRIWHYDNKNKRTSLKWLEFAMRLENVEDLPYEPGTILTYSQMDHIIEYCDNDINATEKFYELSTKHIEIRKFYTKLEGINLINASETKIAKEIFAKYLSKDMNVSVWDLKQMRTKRSYIPIKDIIFPYIKFKHKQNIKMLDYFKSIHWRSTEEGFSTKISHSNEYLNVKREYGEGGLHSFGKAGIYESNDEYIVYDVDFASYYPHLSFVNGLHPEHIPEKIFSTKYKGFYTERQNYPKSNPINYVLKIILNSAYGLSKDKYAYLYDPKWQLAITINGQLLLTMLTEWIVDATSYCKICFENTDGASYIIKKSEKHLVDKVLKEMEQLSGIGLEAQTYKKLIMRDVNNYMSIDLQNKVKFKGAFEIDRDFHKNHSKRIVAIAVANYFINNISPEMTIKNHLKGWDYDFAKNYGIYDFCIGAKMTGKNKLYKRNWIKKIPHYNDDFKINYIINKGYSRYYNNTYLPPNREGMYAMSLNQAFNREFRFKPYIKDIKLYKVTRYYVSNNGSELIKKLPPLEKNYLTNTEKIKQSTPNQTDIFDIIEDIKVDPKHRETNIEAGWLCTVFNKYVAKKEESYDINYKYYIKEVYKIINKIQYE